MASAPRWRVVACVNAPEGDGGDVSVYSALVDLCSSETQPLNSQVSVLLNPSLAEFKEAVTANQPNLIYCCGPSSQQDDKQAGVVGVFRFRDEYPGEYVLLAALQEARCDVVYVDAAVSPHFGPTLHHRGAPHVVVWPADTAIPTAVAAQFNSTFLSFLLNCAASPAEAFAAASHGTQAHCTTLQDGSYASPPLPAFVSSVRPALPDSSSIPPPEVPGLQLSQASLPAFPGWTDVRLLAPRAELRLLLCGDSSLIDPTRLSFLGEALRALLVMEVRALRLLSRTPVDKLPRNLPAGCQAVRCDYATTSGAAGSVVLGAPPSVLEHPGLVQQALRMTLVTDSVSLQFRLPPPGLSLPTPRSSGAVAGGVFVVDTVAVTSVWAVEVLRLLCRDQRYRSLASLGVAAVGNLADNAFSAADVRRRNRLIQGLGQIPAAAAPLQLPITTTASEPAPLAAAAAQSTEALPSPAAAPPHGSDALDLAAAAASGGAYFGNDSLMGYALNGHLQTLGGGGGTTTADVSAAAGNAAAASPDSPDAFGDGGISFGGMGAEGALGFGPGLRPIDGSSPDGGPFGSADPSGAPGFRGGLGRPAGPLSDRRPNLTGDLPGYTCRRAPLASCTESQFYDDLVEFLTVLRGKPIDRARFPEAVLNGVSLDLFSLYREVVTRGGFRVGNGINWKGQVFPRMRNWTETNKQTGVGNALKRHYQNYLWEYEVAHPEDVTLDRCVLCNGGDAVSSDWVCCDACENWAHFSCDKRQGIGTFKDYAQGQGRVYVCPSCTRDQEAGEAVKRQRTA